MVELTRNHEKAVEHLGKDATYAGEKTILQDNANQRNNHAESTKLLRKAYIITVVKRNLLHFVNNRQSKHHVK